ncbi:leucine-rich repeat domain-containing protein [Paludisphaera mucosa]|uniref:Internalin-A n=1 Tax=Paludisphaera mucosa TaxID=3030827 RepID=A0ABT6FA44_9BACT|nr:hypothetical protein [Paludisphaera mucosa]MDG3004458.1 hypothetical protein [Paludisphaera mucosa]
MPTSNESPRRPPRLRVRMSLQAALGLVLLAAAWLGWIAHGARIQRDAVRDVERNGGGVLYDWQAAHRVADVGGEPIFPRWLTDHLGVDVFSDAVYCASCSRQTVDAHLVPIGRLTRLRRLDLSGSGVTDAGLAALEGLQRLGYLELGGTDIGDAGLMHVGRLAALEELYLNGTKVGDAGLAHLKGLGELRTLYLGGTRVTDAGLAEMKGLPNLRALVLLRTRITEAGLLHLKSYPRLEWLVLGNLRIGDAGLAHLKNMRNLRHLAFDDEVVESGISPTAVEELRVALPKLKINY